jgi:hypothetical protein
MRHTGSRIQKYSPESIRGAVGQTVPHTRSVAVIDGNRNVAYLNGNDSNRNLSLNNFDNDWDDNYRFLAVRNYSFFSRDPLSGVLFASCLRHPPSVLPISNN